MHELVGSPVSGLIRGVWGMGDWLAWYGGLGYWVDRLCGWSWGGVLVGCVMFLGMGVGVPYVTVWLSVVL